MLISADIKPSPLYQLSLTPTSILISLENMPILGDSEPPSVQPLYFKSLLELDKWTPGQAGNRYDGILKFKPRESTSTLENRGKLLVI